MIKTTAIDEFKIGQKVYGFYQSIFKEKKISKHGDYYIDILLRDKTGQINGKIWNFIDFYDSVFNEGDLVSVKGEIKRYRKKLFIEIDNISLKLEYNIFLYFCLIDFRHSSLFLRI